jgi:phosphoketolase
MLLVKVRGNYFVKEFDMTLASPPQTKPLTDEELRKMNAYWRAANYLSVGQIYLLDNALLKEPLKIEHINPDFWVTGEQLLVLTSSTFTSTGSSKSMTRT